MQVLYERCCGLDVHSKTVVACLRMPGPDGTRQSVIRTFATTTGALLELAQWLIEAGCTHAAVESTGVYWQPVYNILEGTVEVILVNAELVKAVPGRKTDVKDSEWIAQLLEHGLLRASFIPPRPIRELRELTR
jgi:transposase